MCSNERMSKCIPTMVEVFMESKWKPEFSTAEMAAVLISTRNERALNSLSSAVLLNVIKRKRFSKVYYSLNAIFFAHISH